MADNIAGNDGKTYGVGDAAEKMNVGPAYGSKAVLTPEGKVYDRGELVFDPKVDGLEVRQDDPDIDYVEGVGFVDVAPKPEDED